MSSPQQTPQAPIFDSSKKFAVPILSGTAKRVTVRFPSDGEWCERARKQRSVRRFLGRGKSESEEVEIAGLNVELFNRIRQDDSELDEAEAGLVLSKLERANIESCEREGDRYRISLRVAGGVTHHVVNMPTQRQIIAHERASVRVLGGRRSQEIRGSLEPSGELYDEIATPEAGEYAADRVPIVHKVSVVAEVLQQMSVEDED